MHPEIVGWLGTACLFAGTIRIGGKNRDAFLWYVAGDLIWLGYSVHLQLWSSAFPCAVFAVMAMVNWWRWGH